MINYSECPQVTSSNPEVDYLNVLRYHLKNYIVNPKPNIYIRTQVYKIYLGIKQILVREIERPSTIMQGFRKVPYICIYYINFKIQVMCFNAYILFLIHILNHQLFSLSYIFNTELIT